MARRGEVRAERTGWYASPSARPYRRRTRNWWRFERRRPAAVAQAKECSTSEGVPGRSGAKPAPALPECESGRTDGVATELGAEMTGWRHQRRVTDTVRVIYLGFTPPKKMCSTSFSFSQMFSMMSVSGSRLNGIVTLHGFVYVFGSSNVNSISR